jgi:outer membrane lipoprotein-sorting protein
VSAATTLLRGRHARWAAPIGAVAAVGITIAATAIVGGGQAVPALPARSTAQLLAAVGSPSAFPSAMTAVVQENASLGLPDLPGSSDPLSGLSLLSGTHTFQIWYDGPAKVRVAVPVTMGETDLRRDGRNVWLWQSQTNRATHYVLPPGAATAAPSVPAQSIPAPPQLARQILAAVGATTTVGLQQNVTVAGQPAYQLSLAPKDHRSLIGQVRIAIDARDSLPLQVLVFARGAAHPAFSVGYTSLSFATPAASNFAFSPPPGAKVKTVTIPAGGPVAGPAGGSPSSQLFLSGIVPAAPPPGDTITATLGTSGTAGQVIVTGPKPVPAALLKKLRQSLGKGLPRAVAQAVTSTPSITSGSISSSGNTGQGSVTYTIVSQGVGSQIAPAGPAVLGKGWLSVAVLSPGAGHILPPGAGPAGPSIESGVVSALQSAATPVHGSWGSGRLLRTSLLSFLLLSDGQVLVGAVVPSVLYADAAQALR